MLSVHILFHFRLFSQFSRIQGHISICKSYKFMYGKARAAFCLKRILEFSKKGKE